MPESFLVEMVMMTFSISPIEFCSELFRVIHHLTLTHSICTFYFSSRSESI